MNDVDRLRQFALLVIAEGHYMADVAILAVHGYSDENWKPHTAYSEIAEGAWFVWRDPDNPTENIHVDQVITEAGKITGKYGCGLQWYSECQPCAFAPDLVDAIAKLEESERKRGVRG